MILLSTIVLFVLSSCSQHPDPDSLLSNKETRNELMTAIAGNHSYMMEFMDKMQESEHAMQMMQGNAQMMGHMMQGKDPQMMMKDSTAMHHMMQAMMQDGQMMGHMMQMMHEQGMMSDDCLQSGMKMMEGNH